MGIIEVEKTEISPTVVLNHIENIFLFEGESRPENAKKFYTPIIDWLSDFNKYLYLEKSKLRNATSPVNLDFIFHFDYINSSSLKCLYDVLLKIEALKENADSLKVTWLFDPDDESMEDNGKEFASMLHIDFDIRLAN